MTDAESAGIGNAVTPARDAGEQRRGWRHPVWASVVTAALSVVALPVVGIAAFALSMSLTSYDTSGQGGPFRSCGPDSTQCDGGSPFGVVISLAVIVAVIVGVAFAGQAIGRHSSAAVGRFSMGVLGVLTMFGGLVVTWSIMVHPA